MSLSNSYNQNTKKKHSFFSFLNYGEVSGIKEKLIAISLFVCGILSIFITIGIIFALFSEAISFFMRPEVNLWTFLTGTNWRPLASKVVPENFGVRPLIQGTLLIAVISALIAIPLGLGSAIYLSEYSSSRIRNVVKPLLEILAGVPTVVYGYFALSFITPLIISFFEDTLGVEVRFFNALSAAIVVGIMIIPTVASISEDAMRAVPRSLREGAYALGATKFEVSTKVVVPAALSGIISAFILGISRAIGETMAVTIAAGATPRLTWNPLESVQTMTSFIVQVSFGDAPAGSINGQSIFAVGATLFVMTFLMNIISDLIVKRFREVYN
ncbi:MAG: phosphate ABC transporter permease subunit PstC [Chloroflexi bacterium HGW-Chloroflexi-8]|jgi:phosphate transport system permease protein|nr:MAG: phosphate ABC transporter permease subunit PstC [Chloroflexi bacterium HGW-Chloroflexi-8]